MSSPSCTKCEKRLVVVDVGYIDAGLAVTYQCLFCDLGAMQEKPRMELDELEGALGLSKGARDT